MQKTTYIGESFISIFYKSSPFLIEADPKTLKPTAINLT